MVCKDNRFIFSDNNYRLIWSKSKDKPEFSDLFKQVHPDDKAIGRCYIRRNGKKKIFLIIYHQN